MIDTANNDLGLEGAKLIGESGWLNINWLNLRNYPVIKTDWELLTRSRSELP